ncbi:glycosyltransferase family 2 protein [Convivina intestini]|uniref:glycosyltransferase family 2 protein n=1 Tax=Convivina intestini TaxID=1505726 RepID=UPI00200D42D8|nr:glycosyltransferase family 2 protein [Convivina intestini]
MNQKKLTIVVPAYNEEPVIEKTTTVLTNILKKLINENQISANSTLLYVDDGSKDRTWEMIGELHNGNSMITGIKFAHNAGHQNALIAGIETAQDSDYIVTIDADLQDSPEAIIEMVHQANEGKDIVFGVRNNRDSDTWFKKNSAGLFYKIMGFLGVEEIPNHADFRLIDKRVTKAFLQYPEREMYLRGIFPQLGFNQGEVYYARTERQAGESKYPLSKMLSLAIDGITSFSVKPIKMIRNVGLLVALIGLLYLAYSVVGKMMGHNITGWTSIVTSIWLLGGFQLIALGIVGEYIGRIFTEVKHRPRYFIEEKKL